MIDGLQDFNSKTTPEGRRNSEHGTDTSLEKTPDDASAGQFVWRRRNAEGSQNDQFGSMSNQWAILIKAISHHETGSTAISESQDHLPGDCRARFKVNDHSVLFSTAELNNIGMNAIRSETSMYCWIGTIRSAPEALFRRWSTRVDSLKSYVIHSTSRRWSTDRPCSSLRKCAVRWEIRLRRSGLR
jgi:hypothetical protein